MRGNHSIRCRRTLNVLYLATATLISAATVASATGCRLASFLIVSSGSVPGRSLVMVTEIRAGIGQRKYHASNKVCTYLPRSMAGVLRLLVSNASLARTDVRGLNDAAARTLSRRSVKRLKCWDELSVCCAAPLSAWLCCGNCRRAPRTRDDDSSGQGTLGGGEPSEVTNGNTRGTGSNIC